MTPTAQRPRLLVLSTLLGASVLASCIEIEDASDKKKATADSAAGAVAATAASTTPIPPPSARFGPDSATRVRGGPMWTAEQTAAMQSDTAHDITDIDTTIVSDGAPGAARGNGA